VSPVHEKKISIFTNVETSKLILNVLEKKYPFYL